MSTHCLICKDNAPDKSKGIYCHSDGYIENVGFILQAFYNTPEKVDALLALGDISRLGYEIGDKMDFSKNMLDSEYYSEHENQCVSYHRDRGEDFHQFEYSSIDRMIDRAGETYNYVFKNGSWMVGILEYDKEEDDIQLRSLSDVLKENSYINSPDFQKSLINDESISEAERDAIVNTLEDLSVLHDEVNSDYSQEDVDR